MSVLNHRVENRIVVVSGLPRSGTSMMMRALFLGGLPILTDEERQADADNPHGYFEFEPVKKLRESADWLPEAVGKAVKIISFLLEALPPTYRYDVIFMQRAIPEVLASQRQMLLRRGETPDPPEKEAKLAQIYEKHLAKIQAWLQSQPNIRTHFVEYRQVLSSAQPVLAGINEFLGGTLNLEAMCAAVDPALYRQRHNA
jgi:hypothetical protein